MILPLLCRAIIASISDKMNNFGNSQVDALKVINLMIIRVICRGLTERATLAQPAAIATTPQWLRSLPNLVPRR